MAVRLGDAGTRNLYLQLMIGVGLGVVACASFRPTALLGLIGVAFAVPPVRAVLSGAAGRDLIPTLGATGRVQLMTGLLLAVGLALG